MESTDLNTVVAALSVKLSSLSFTNEDLIAEACWWLQGIGQYVIQGYRIKEGNNFRQSGEDIRDSLCEELDHRSPDGYYFNVEYNQYGYFKEL